MTDLVDGSFTTDGAVAALSALDPGSCVVKLVGESLDLVRQVCRCSYGPPSFLVCPFPRPDRRVGA